MTARQQIQLVQRILRNSYFFQKGKKGPTQGISKDQLAKLLSITPSAVNNWLKGNNSINSANLAFLQKLDRLTDAHSSGNPITHTVLKKKVIRKVVMHGISKFDPFKYKFLTTGQKHWTNVHAITV